MSDRVIIIGDRIALIAPDAERHYFSRERDFPSSSLAPTLALLHAEAATGQLVLHFSQGGISAIQFRESVPLDNS